MELVMPISVDEAEVLSSNRAFYAAFRNRDLGRMEDLWAREAQVACVHPGWQPIRGRQQVMASWRAILGQSNTPDIDCEGATASIFGDTALVLCEEALEEGRLVATNLFVREAGEWRICHHQAGPLAQSQSDDSDSLTELLDDDSSDSRPSLLAFAPRPPRRLPN
jgi:ketosteroid isomerase-like protein